MKRVCVGVGLYVPILTCNTVLTGHIAHLCEFEMKMYESFRVVYI